EVLDRWQVGVDGWVCRDQSLSVGVAEQLSQRRDRVSDRAGREAAVFEVGDQLVDVADGDRGESVLAEGGEDVQLERAPVLAVRPWREARVAVAAAGDGLAADGVTTFEPAFCVGGERLGGWLLPAGAVL